MGDESSVPFVCTCSARGGLACGVHRDVVWLRASKQEGACGTAWKERGGDEPQLRMGGYSVRARRESGDVCASAFVAALAAEGDGLSRDGRVRRGGCCVRRPLTGTLSCGFYGDVRKVQRCVLEGRGPSQWRDVFRGVRPGRQRRGQLLIARSSQNGNGSVSPAEHQPDENAAGADGKSSVSSSSSSSVPSLSSARASRMSTQKGTLSSSSSSVKSAEQREREKGKSSDKLKDDETLQQQSSAACASSSLQKREDESSGSSQRQFHSALGSEVTSSELAQCIKANQDEQRRVLQSVSQILSGMDSLLLYQNVLQDKGIARLIELLRLLDPASMEVEDDEDDDDDCGEGENDHDEDPEDGSSDEDSDDEASMGIEDSVVTQGQPRGVGSLLTGKEMGRARSGAEQTRSRIKTGLRAALQDRGSSNSGRNGGGNVGANSQLSRSASFLRSFRMKILPENKSPQSVQSTNGSGASRRALKGAQKEKEARLNSSPLAKKLESKAHSQPENRETKSDDTLHEYDPSRLDEDAEETASFGKTYLADITEDEWQTMAFSPYNEAALLEAFGAFYRVYAETGARSWREHVIDCIMLDQNPFTLMCQQAADAMTDVSAGIGFASGAVLDHVDTDMLAAARSDLERLELLSVCSPQEVSRWIYVVTGVCTAFEDETWPEREAPISEGKAKKVVEDAASDRSPVLSKLSAHTQGLSVITKCAEFVFDDENANAKWAGCVSRLAAFHANHGSGMFAKGAYFRWNLEERVLSWHPDSAVISMLPRVLFGVDDAIASLSRNLQFLLHGFAAQHTLILGPRGSGKSVLLKYVVAELNRRTDSSRLKVIELERLSDLIDIRLTLETDWNLQRRRSLKFVLAVDELAVDDEDDLRSVLSVLDGGVPGLPPNVVVIAAAREMHGFHGTSSGYAEVFSSALNDDNEADQGEEDGGPGGASGQFHGMFDDEGLLALKERFALQIRLPNTTQERYMNAVKTLAEEHGLLNNAHEQRNNIHADILEMRALRFARERSSYSLRVATQFVTFLHSEQALFRASQVEKERRKQARALRKNKEKSSLSVRTSKSEKAASKFSIRSDRAVPDETSDGSEETAEGEYDEDDDFERRWADARAAFKASAAGAEEIRAIGTDSDESTASESEDDDAEETVSGESDADQLRGIRLAEISIDDLQLKSSGREMAGLDEDQNLGLGADFDLDYSSSRSSGKSVDDGKEISHAAGDTGASFTSASAGSDSVPDSDPVSTSGSLPRSGDARDDQTGVSDHATSVTSGGSDSDSPVNANLELELVDESETDGEAETEPETDQQADVDDVTTEKESRSSKGSKDDKPPPPSHRRRRNKN
ncbi:hypothetical protein FVE85_3654 [Porphyridium purpureum]|uniref:AAA+ ATPase domain-containing protein n=1 Tax=Porphyridium purpureum TaxID=35688 RepID=A0A5J4YLB3_PORPP|nr:hypothetical protein FVE85_3654 [Porphyridium purpureum]|eukprot:POR9041..scf249_10